MARRVIVGWDGSAAAAGALDWAVRHSPAAESLELVVVEGAGRQPDGPRRDPGEAAALVRAAHPGIAVTVGREHGDVAEVLAGRSGSDALIAIGGRRNEESRHLRRTSTGYRVVLEATGPVVVVPQSYTGGRTVLVGIEGRSDAACVVLTAAAEADRRRQQLVAVHVPRPVLGMGVGALPGDPARRSDADGAQQMVEDVLAPVRAAYPSLQIVTRITTGRASDVLLSAARGAMLLVLGRNPDPPANRRPVTHSSMLLSAAPVLVVPPETRMD